MPTLPSLVTNTAQVQILSVEDTTQNVLVNRTASPFLDVTFAEGMYYETTTDTSPHSFEFPFLIAGQIMKHFYVRNTSVAGSLWVSGSVNGSAPSPNLAILGPGDVFIYWQGSANAQPAGGISQGFTGLTYQGSAIGISFEWFVGI
jgi:hypothetical protein